eukprot:1189669-Prorocentrum_minimum.AAC.6
MSKLGGWNPMRNSDACVRKSGRQLFPRIITSGYCKEHKGSAGTLNTLGASGGELASASDEYTVPIA